jgi:hypothetical protein
VTSREAVIRVLRHVLFMLEGDPVEGLPPRWIDHRLRGRR